MHKVICFDFWNTLAYSVKSDGAGYEEILINYGVKKTDIYPIVRDRLMNRKMAYREMVDFLFSYFCINGKNIATAKKEAIIRWRQDNTNVEWFKGALELLGRIKKQGYPLLLISNITWPAWESIRNIFNTNDLLGKFFLSCEQGISKPDSQVWQIIQSWFPEVLAKNFYMIGDNQKDDLDIPADLGWNTILVKKDGSDINNLLSKLLVGGDGHER